MEPKTNSLQPSSISYNKAFSPSKLSRVGSSLKDNAAYAGLESSDTALDCSGEKTLGNTTTEDQHESQSAG